MVLIEQSQTVGTVTDFSVIRSEGELIELTGFQEAKLCLLKHQVGQDGLALAQSVLMGG